MLSLKTTSSTRLPLQSVSDYNPLREEKRLQQLNQMDKKITNMRERNFNLTQKVQIKIEESKKEKFKKQLTGMNTEKDFLKVSSVTRDGGFLTSPARTPRS
jgi:TolA-binding protein